MQLIARRWPSHYAATYEKLKRLIAAKSSSLTSNAKSEPAASPAFETLPQPVIVSPMPQTGTCESAAPAKRMQISAAIDWLLIVALYLAYWILLSHQGFGDDVYRIELVQKLAGVPLDVSNAQKFSIIQPVFMLPLYNLGSKYLLFRFNCMIAAVGVAALYWLLRRSVDPKILRKFILILLAASMMAHWTMYLDAEMFSAMAIAVGCAALVTNRPLLAVTPLALGAVNTPGLLPALALAVGWYSFNRRRWRYLLIPAVAGGLFLLECRFRRGGWFITRYEGDHGFANIMPYSGRPGFSYPLFFGLLSIFFSYGKGLIFFTPGLFLPLADSTAQPQKKLREFHSVCLWFVSGMVLLYARFWSWYGGFSWGPRFFLFASIPASLVLATWLSDKSLPLARRGVVGALLILSAWVGINGAVFDLNGLHFVATNNYAQEYLTWYTPEFSPLWHPLVSAPPITVKNGVFIVLVLITTLWLLAPLACGLRAATASSAGPSKKINPPQKST